MRLSTVLEDASTLDIDFLDFDEPAAVYMHYVPVETFGLCFVDRWGRIKSGAYHHRVIDGVHVFGPVVPTSECKPNIYGEMTVYQGDKLIPYGAWIEETEQAIFFGAYTEIALVPNIPEFPAFEEDDCWDL